MVATRKQKGGVMLTRRRARPTRKYARRMQVRIGSPRRRITPAPSRSRSRSRGSPRNECASLYSALDYIPEIPNISNNNMNARLDKVRARIEELQCGNSGRTD